MHSAGRRRAGPAGRTRDKQLKALYQAGAAAVRLGERRDLGRVVQHERGLLQPRLHHLRGPPRACSGRQR